MKRWLGIVGLVGLMGLYSLPSFAKADYSLVLIGGGLKFCTSLTTRECQTPLKVTPDDHVDYTYQITAARLAELRQSHWLPQRQLQKLRLLNAMEQVAQQTSGVLTRRQLLSALRAVEIIEGQKKLSGMELLSSLMDDEYFMLLDILQLGNIDENLLSSNEHRKIKVAVKNSKSHFSQKVLREFIKQAQILSQGKTPNILLVTSATRDQFVSVDLYQQVLTALGAKVRWVPLDKALFAAVEANRFASKQDACDNIEHYRQTGLGVYGRARIFPSLHKQQVALCQNPEEIKTLLANAHGLFFSEGEGLRLTAQFSLGDPLSQAIKTEINQRIANASLVVAADQGAAMAMVGSRDLAQPQPMIVAGNSHQALLSGALETSESLQDCEKAQRCPKQYKDGQVLYHKQGLGLFPFGVVDTQFSELGRQGRLLTLLANTEATMGYGIDERTALLVGFNQDDNIPVRMEVIGENGVAIFDSTEVERDQGFGDAILSLRSHYLTDEDKLFFRNRKLIISFADWKYSSNSHSRPVIKSGAVFRSDNYRRTLAMLCGTGANSATMKHAVLGSGHTLYVTKSRTSISLAGKRNVAGDNFSYCSYRDYYLDISRL